MRRSVLPFVAALLVPVSLFACGGGGDSDDLTPDGGGGSGGTVVVTPRLACEAGELDFGEVTRGVPQTVTVRCRNDGDGAWTLVAGEVEEVATEITPAGSLEPGETWELAVTWTPGSPEDLDAELALLDEHGRTVAALALRGEEAGHCIEAQGNLDFGTIAPGTSKSLGLGISNRCSHPVAVTSIVLDASSHASFTWLPNEFPAEVPGVLSGVSGTLLVDVTFEARADESGRKNGILVLSTNDGSTPRMDFLLTGTIAAP